MRRECLQVAQGCFRALMLLICSAGLIPINSKAVIPFTNTDRRRKNTSTEIPQHCANGHRLTPDNVRMDQRERRWRCRQCARERAAVFRQRQKRAA